MRVEASRRERIEMLRFCAELDDAEWRTASRAEGWRVQDVLAHIGSGCKAVFSPALLKLVTSRNIEQTNDVFVARRREWAPAHVLAEYQQWSKRLAALAGGIARTPMNHVRIPLAELGRFPVGLVLGGAMAFDHHTHLRHDMAPALGRPAPDTDAVRMAVVVEWMFAVLASQLQSARPDWLMHSIAVTIDGPGGGVWEVQSSGAVTAGRTGHTAAEISSRASEFPAWATRRAAWRDQDIQITGDAEYATLFLDNVNVI